MVLRPASCDLVYKKTGRDPATCAPSWEENQMTWYPQPNIGWGLWSMGLENNLAVGLIPAQGALAAAVAPELLGADQRLAFFWLL